MPDPLWYPHHPPPPGVRFVAARWRNVDLWQRRTAGHGSGIVTHLARVDLLTAEGIVVGTHVGGVGVIPVC